MFTAKAGVKEQMARKSDLRSMSHFFGQLNLEGVVWGSGLRDPAGGGFSKLG